MTTLVHYLRVLREQWAVVLTAVVVALAAAAAFWFLRPPEYTATLRMYVSAQSTDSAQAAFQGAQLSQQRVSSYVELVSTRRVSEEVIRQLDLSVNPDELAKHIAATSKLDSVVIDVAVTGESPPDIVRVANAIGTIFPRLVDELERPSSPTGTPPVVVRVIQPASIPEGPSSAGLPLTLVLGLFAGIVVGLSAALTRNVLDTSIKSPDRLRAVAKVPNLGNIAFDPNVPKRPLTLHEDPQSPRSEAFRQLRTNLQFLDVDTPHKVVVVTSSMPGEGKTTTVANLAIAMASAGKRVLTVEADLRRPKLADVLGIERSVGLTSILAGRIRPEHAVQHWSGGVLDVLTSGPLPPNPSELLASRYMAGLLEELRGQYDLILLDTPPLLPVTDAAAVAPATDGVILVCRFKQTRCAQAEAAVEALAAVSAKLLGTVFTMVPSRGIRAYAQYNSYYRSEQLVVPTSPAVGTRTVTSKPPADVTTAGSNRHNASRPGPAQARPAR